MPFAENTRLKRIALPSIAKGTSNPVTFALPKSGLLAGIYLAITGSVAGTLSAPNALGFSSIVRRVRLTANAGLQLIDVSGPEYHYLLRDYLDDEKDVVPGTNGRTAVTATTFDISMYFPIAINRRDPIGLIMLQNEQTQLTLSIEFEADATVATGATVTATVQPMLELFTVPAKREDYPALNVAHTIIGDERTISGAGSYEYKLPRGNTYLQVLHGLGIGVSGSDGFSAFNFLINQSDQLEGIYTSQLLDMVSEVQHGRTRLAGVAGLDFAGSSGFGNYGSLRDVVYSQMVTEISTYLTATGAATLYTVRRQLVNLLPAQ